MGNKSGFAGAPARYATEDSHRRADMQSATKARQVAKLFADAAKAGNMTQQELAKLCGISNGTLHRLMSYDELSESSLEKIKRWASGRVRK